jgi:hypothetical protein
LPPPYLEACRAAAAGDHETARGLYHTLALTVRDKRLRALVVNDLAALALVRGDVPEARGELEAALSLDPRCRVAYVADGALARKKYQSGDFSPHSKRGFRRNKRNIA